MARPEGGVKVGREGWGGVIVGVDGVGLGPGAGGVGGGGGTAVGIAAGVGRVLVTVAGLLSVLT